MVPRAYSPFRKDPRSLQVTEADEALLKGEYAHSYHAEDWIEVTGRGLIAIIKHGIRPSLGDHVLIDGTPYRVRGIETLSPYRPPFGLLVTEDEPTWVLRRG